MKDKILWIIIALITLTVLGVILVFTAKKTTVSSIESLKSLHFSYSNGYMMNAYTTYDISLEDDTYYVTIKPYGIPEEESQKVKLDNETIEKLINVLNEYNVAKWDGFHKSDQNVLDGDSFSFSMYTLEDRYISASGYMSWPENYRNIEDAFDEILGSLYVQKVE